MSDETFDFGSSKVIELGVSPFTGCAGRGVSEPAILSPIERPATPVPLSVNVIRVSPHLGTHLDLPWAMLSPLTRGYRALNRLRNWVRSTSLPAEDRATLVRVEEFLDEIETSLSGSGWQTPEHYGLPPGPPPADIGPYLRPQIVECIVLDLSDMLDIMQQHVDPDEPSPATVISPALDVDAIVSLVKRLCIDRDRIERAIDQSWPDRPPSLCNKLLILSTCWSRAFRPKTISHGSHPSLEGFSPWLVHPYLDGETARWLAGPDGANVWGISIDCIGLEMPLYYAEDSAYGPVIEARHRLLALEQFPQSWELAHLHILWNGKRLIENSKSVSVLASNECAQGRACVIPLPVTALTDGAFIRMFVEVGEVAPSKSPERPRREAVPSSVRTMVESDTRAP